MTASCKVFYEREPIDELVDTVRFLKAGLVTNNAENIHVTLPGLHDQEHTLHDDKSVFSKLEYVSNACPVVVNDGRSFQFEICVVLGCPTFESSRRRNSTALTGNPKTSFVRSFRRR